MDKENVVYIHAMECYSALKRKETLPFVTTWMDLDDIMLSEISQTQKDKYCMFSLVYESKIVILIGAENRMVAAGGGSDIVSIVNQWKLGMHSPTTAPSRSCSFFPTLTAHSFSLTAFRAVSPE